MLAMTADSYLIVAAPLYIVTKENRTEKGKKKMNFNGYFLLDKMVSNIR